MLLISSRKEFSDAICKSTGREGLLSASIDEALSLVRERSFGVIMIDRRDVANAEFVAGLFAKGAVGSPLILVAAEGAKAEPTPDERFTSFMDNLPGQAFIKDDHGRYFYANQSLLSAFGVAIEDVIGKTDAEFLPPDLAAQCQASDKIAMASKVVYQAPETFAIDGRAMHMLVTKFPLGHSDMFGGIATDITAQKEVEAELARAKDAAVAASQSKSSFVAQMSHEIRTPLNAIIGFADILDMPSLSDGDRTQYLDIIRRNGRELARLVDDILDLAKVEANHLEFQPSEVKLSDVLDDVAASFGHMAGSKGLKFEVCRELGAPDFIRTDAARLRQILINIVGNAIKFTDNGGVSVCTTTVNGDGQVSFVVRDSGMGISEDLRRRLFQPFTQGASSSKGCRGTGLGLALSRHLARALGGDVVLTETRPGVGSTFVISVAAGQCRQGVATTTHATDLSLPDMATDETSTLPGLRVLVVDDSRENQLLVSQMLSLAGAEVTLADNGQAAVDAAHHQVFDVILMDVQMPVMGGYEATRELRRRGFDRPIVALTAHAMFEERVECLAAGCDKHLPKPITRSALISALAPYHGNSHRTSPRN